MDLTVILFAAFLCWLVLSGLGGWIAAQKGRQPIEGAILGFVFGPLGCLIEALLPNQNRRRDEDRDYVSGPVRAQRPEWSLSFEEMEAREQSRTEANRAAVRQEAEDEAAFAFLADAEAQAGGVKPIEPVPLDAIEWAVKADERERRKAEEKAIRRIMGE